MVCNAACRQILCRLHVVFHFFNYLPTLKVEQKSEEALALLGPLSIRARVSWRKNPLGHVPAANHSLPHSLISQTAY